MFVAWKDRKACFFTAADERIYGHEGKDDQLLQ